MCRGGGRGARRGGGRTDACLSCTVAERDLREISKREKRFGKASVCEVFISKIPVYDASCLVVVVVDGRRGLTVSFVLRIWFGFAAECGFLLLFSGRVALWQEAGKNGGEREGIKWE